MRFKPYSSMALVLSGATLVVLASYFLFLRPPLLPEDLRFLRTSLAQIEATMPELLIWLRRVFWVMGGYMLATGLLTLYVAITSFRARMRGAAGVVTLAGLISIGWMVVVNFIIDSDFKWLLLSLVFPWVLALLLYFLERGKPHQ